MAGGIGTYAVDGITFATIGAAITQMIADEDGAALTEDQILLLSINTTENPILPSHNQVQTSGQFNLILRGTGANKTITGNITSTGATTAKCRFFFMDNISLSSGANDGITMDNQEALHILIKDSDITSTGTKNCLFDMGNVLMIDSDLDAGFRAIRSASSVILRGVKMKCDEGITIAPTGTSGELYMENCRCIQSGSSTLKLLFTPVQDTFKSAILLHNTISGFTDIILSSVNNNQWADVVIMENNIFDGFTHAFINIAGKTTEAPFITGASPWVMRDNIISNQTGTDLLVFDDQTLTNAQAISEGIDNGTKSFNVTFQSTVFSNANFLKYQAADDTDVNFARPSGILADFSGTNRLGNPIAAGAFQLNAVGAPDFPDKGNVTQDDTTDGITGTYHESTTAEVQTGVTFGEDESLTGTFAGVTSPGVPTLNSATIGDTQIVLNFTAAVETDTIQARFRLARIGEIWDTENPTFSRTGSGDITITGLVNNTRYEFVGYAKN